MDFRERLLRNYQAIVDDLDVQHIHAELFQNNALTSGDFDHLSEMKTRDERTRYLLDTLINKGSISAYETFLDSLAKDYSWLRDKLIENNDAMMNDSFEDSLSKGDVPRLPDHYVKRTQIERKIVEQLEKLKRHQILALHGMSGCGKTVAAISALRDNPDLIVNNFQGVVMWLNLGNCKTDDDIIAQQTKLLRKATSMYTRQSYMNSSISMSSICSNGDSQSLSTIDWTWHDLRDKLKTQFLEPSLKECLLVLDEVNLRSCLEAFDIGCKILITTRDTEVVANYHPSLIVKIENHLQKEETLQLFASCLDEPVYKLPRQAKTLHEVCKGSPFHIALIGAQLAENKEKLKDNPRHWDYYVKKLEKKEFIFLTKPNDNPMKTIEMCINSLNDNILQLFKKLGALPDNVKISAKVLSKLWNKDTSEVTSIMKQLKSKSLIIETYDRDQRNYLYEVHDLIMNHLRKCLNEDDKRKLHDHFLNNYNYTKNNTPIDITDDGYIAFYIGFHILNTNDYNNRWSLFKTLFLDLKFLGNKVRLTGPADVILDLQKYENYIATNDVDRSLVLSIKAYLSTHGTDLYHYQCTDIVQSILQHESSGILFMKATEIAQSNCEKNELYFDFLHEEDVDGIKHSTIDVKDKITSICFLGDYILVGTNSGTVKFFHIPNNKLKKELCEGESPRAPVKWVGVAYSINPPLVTALYYDGVIKLWYVDDLEQDDAEDVIEEEPEESYNNNLPGNITILPKHGHVTTCRWTTNEDILIALTNKKIILYKPNGEIFNEIDNFQRDCELLCCMPCSNDRYLAVATTGTGKGVEVIDLKTKERFMCEEPTDQTDIVLDIITVPGSNKIITIKNKEITQYEFKINPGINKSCTWKIKSIITSFDVKMDMCFLSIAVNKIGTLLFVSTDDCRVLCIDLKTNSYVLDLDNRRGNVVTMAVSEILLWDELVPGSDVLLTGTDTMENSAKVWFLDSSYVAQATQKCGKVRLTTKFDVSFLNTSSPLTPSTSTPNSGTESANNTPKRHQSFANHKEVTKKLLKNSKSLDRHSLKPLNLKGICNSTEGCPQPLLVVIDDKNNIQVMRGKKVLTEVSETSEDPVTHVKITPCNQHIVYALKSGLVKRYTLRTKEVITIMDLYGPAQYLNFVNSNLLMVSGKNRRIMAYKLGIDGVWNTVMLERGNTYLGSQEILNDIQGIKIKKTNGQSEMTNSESDVSLESKDRMFPNSDSKSLCKGSGLIECFWLSDRGLITVEHNASIKLWDFDLKLKCVLNARQLDVTLTSAALKKDVLVICDGPNMMFQTFDIKFDEKLELISIQEFQLNNEITCCDLTSDGNILAMGLDSGNVVIWNVRSQRQISLLRHHKSKVQSCSFSAVPDRLYRQSTHYASPLLPTNFEDDSQPPLVLVTMATEIVWWNITYDMRMRASGKLGRPGLKAMTPLATTPIATTPLDNRAVIPNDNNANKFTTNHFFADGLFNQFCWKALWKGKTYKQGSKRKEILACIKLSGVTAKRLCHDDQFSCFVTVDNSGHVHVMSVMNAACT